MTDLEDRQAQEAERIVREIVDGTLRAGGNETDVMILIQRIVLGALLSVSKLGDGEKLLQILTEEIREDFARLKLAKVEPRGRT